MQLLIFAISGGLALFWILLALRRPGKPDANVISELRYGRGVRILALIFALAPPTVMAYIVAAFHWRSTQMLGLAGAGFVFTSLIAGLFHIEAAGLRIVLTEEGIIRFSPWTGKTSLKWGDVQRIRYSVINRWFLITGAGRAIRVSLHLGGMRVFVETVRRKVPAERYIDAAPTMARIS